MTGKPYAYIGEVGEELTVTGTGSERKIIHAQMRRGDTHFALTPWLLRIESGDALVVVVTSARWARFADEGQQITVVGVVKEHRRWHNENLTLLNRAQRPGWSFEEEIRRRISVRWELVNPAESAPRPFPGQADPLDTTDASSFIRSLVGVAPCRAHRPRTEGDRQ